MMNKKTFYVVVLVMLSTLLTEGPKVLSQEKSPSKEETLRWLEKTISDYGSFQNDSGSFRTVIESTNFDGCNISWRETLTTKYDGSEKTYKGETIIPLGDLDPSKLEVESYDDKMYMMHKWFVVLHTSNDRASIQATVNGEKRKNKKTTIEFKDESIARRVAKAFTHAIKLCNSGMQNREPF